MIIWAPDDAPMSRRIGAIAAAPRPPHAPMRLRPSARPTGSMASKLGVRFRCRRGASRRRGGGPAARSPTEILRSRCLRDRDRFVVDVFARLRLHALEIDGSRWRRAFVGQSFNAASACLTSAAVGPWHQCHWTALSVPGMTWVQKRLGGCPKFPIATGCDRAAFMTTGRTPC